MDAKTLVWNLILPNAQTSHDMTRRGFFSSGDKRSDCGTSEGTTNSLHDIQVKTETSNYR